MNKSSEKSIQVYCGELCKSSVCTSEEINLINYPINSIESNVTIGYEGFVYDPKTLSDRVLDLLQIAAMVFCADRMAGRGERESISNRGWARTFEFHISVLDYDFWKNDRVKDALSEVLTFMTGDRYYSFDFCKAAIGHFEGKKYEQLSFFTKESDRVYGIEESDIMLFSGGLDSLAGLLENLNNSNHKIITVSHKSNTGVIHTQNQLINKLNRDYDGRIIPYGFYCHNKGKASIEETQRTRMFLFSAIAFAVCHCFDKHRFYIYENGVTSLNYPVQTDVINARASRTTHPKTIGLLRKFYRLFDDSFDIDAPYYNKTKEDIIKVFEKLNCLDLINSAVSCSATRKQHGMTPHCGCCSQCIDRKLAVFAAGLNDYDAVYSNDFIQKIEDSETSQRLYRQMRFASGKSYLTSSDLLKNYPTETQDAIEYWPCDNPEDSLNEIFVLLNRYSDSVLRAAKRIQMEYEDLRNPVVEDSFLKIVTDREYLKTPFERRAKEIDEKLRQSLPVLFRTEKPKNENDFNNKVAGLLGSGNEHWTREYPIIKFGITNYRADISFDDLIIESKYIRGNTSPSVATDGIAADITKLDEKQHVFFVVYDPERSISDDDEYCSNFMRKNANCIVKVYR